MSKATDITIIGNGGSAHATSSTAGSIPMDQLEDLFGFSARFTRLYVPGGDGVVEVPGRKAVVHGDTGDVLNVVGSTYAIHQYRDVLLDNVSALLDTGRGELEVTAAGLLDKGGVGWVQVSAPQGVGFDGQSEVSPTLTVVTSHNGKYATSFRTGLFRFQCSNQLGGALRRKVKNVYKLRHTRHSAVQVLDARDALGVMWNNAEQAVADMRSLQRTAFTNAQFLELIEQAMPKPKEKLGPNTHMTDLLVTNASAITRWEAKRDDLWNVWNSDPRVGDAYGTAWGAVQAFSTYRQHVATFRGTSSGSISRDGRNMAALLAGHTDRQDRAVATRALAIAGA